MAATVMAEKAQQGPERGKGKTLEEMMEELDMDRYDDEEMTGKEAVLGAGIDAFYGALPAPPRPATRPALRLALHRLSCAPPELCNA